jgi:hypothetical protein
MLRSRARSAHAPSPASTTANGTDATPTCVPVFISCAIASPTQQAANPASAPPTAISQLSALRQPQRHPFRFIQLFCQAKTASGGDLGLQDGRRRLVEVLGWLRRKPGHPAA